MKIKKPVTLTMVHAFKFYSKNLLRKNPHLVLKYENSHRPTEIWSINKKELQFLHAEELRIDEEIMKLEKIDKDKEKFTKTTSEIFPKMIEIYRRSGG